MDKLLFPDYKNCILSIPNSILSFYGAKTHHDTLNLIDEKLNKKYRNVVLYIFDGLGMEILQKHSPNGFFMKNCLTQLTSVYPCTTTTALTTYQNGLSPIEHAWLGWAQYFKEIDKCVELFNGNDSYTDLPDADYDVVSKNIGYRNLFQQINEVDPQIVCHDVSAFGDIITSSNQEICTNILELCGSAERHYIYAYNNEPDGLMHRL